MTDRDTMKECMTGIIKLVAILGINALALYYDGQWLPVAIGIDAFILGIEIRHKFIINKNKRRG